MKNWDLDSRVRDWYVSNFPADEAGKDLNSDLTFWTLYNALGFVDIYEILGGDADSVIRERVFQGLADMLGCDYDLIYYMWLGEWLEVKRILDEMDRKICEEVCK